ncbi:cytochrome P450 [Fomes fomentarius]|nr:cytochrome P450 [Fomes fomentarius]
MAALASFTHGVLSLIIGVVLVGLIKILRRLLTIYVSPLRQLRGPPSKSFLYGNMVQIGPEHLELNRQWVKAYGTNFRGSGLFSAPRLWTIDPRVINHILTHSMDYYKPGESRRNLARILGQGVLVTEGEKHRQQRRVMNPAFGPAQIRELTEIFLEKANDLCAYWNRQITEADGVLCINIIEGLSKMTLDVIGLAGFNYHFETLNPDIPPNELSKAFHAIFKQPPQMTLMALLRNALPSLSILRDERTKKVDGARAAMQRIARQILTDRKAEIIRESNEKPGALEKKDLQGRDLLTLLIKANMATDIPENQRMTDEEVLSQVPTFLVAGHETTSTSTTWCLYAITRNPSIQRKLREEFSTLDTDIPTMEDLSSLPYLEKVVHETLRLHAPVTITNRVAMRDDVLPVSAPFMDKYGRVQNEIRIAKGERILIPITTLHTSEDIWGPDASEFNPDRWDNPPEAIKAIPGVWGHLLTFLGGPHACIGYRFSLVEMKALVYTLVRNFEFEFAVPAEDIKASGTFIQRPALRSEPEKGAQLPLLIRPYRRTA